MEDSKVDVLFMDTIQHEKTYIASSTEKVTSQDQIKFNDPVKLQLLRIPHNGRNMHNKFNSKTQKQPIKSFEVFFRNLNKRNSRFDIITCSSSELLVSSTSDILIPIREPIYTDLLVIRGSFTSITLCVYGRVISEPEEIEKKCPYFNNDLDYIEEEKPALIKIERNVFEESRTMVKAIQDEYSDENIGKIEFQFQEKFNDSYLHKQQISLILKQCVDLQKYEDLKNVNQSQISNIRKSLQTIQTNLSKLLKSSHIGLYYPPGHRASSIPDEIPSSIMKIMVQLLSLDLSDQSKALQVLKMIIQLEPHARQFIQLGGVESLIRIFVEFFNPVSVIFSSLKSLLIQVLISLSFWQDAAKIMVKEIYPVKLVKKVERLQEKDSSEEKQKSRQRQRSRQKKKKKSISEQRSESRKKGKRSSSKRKEKKSKKHKDKDKKKGRSSSKVRQTKKQEKNQSLQVEQAQQKKYIQILRECNSFYEFIFKVIRVQKNSKILHLSRILVQQITQTLTKNKQLSIQMANFTPLLRDTKYMFNQGGQIIGSKSLKMFSSFKPFLNQQQSKGIDSSLISHKQKAKNPQNHHLSLKICKMIDLATTIFQVRGQQNMILTEHGKQKYYCFPGTFQHYDEEFLTLLSTLILENGKTDMGFNLFIDAIRLDDLGIIKKNEAILALIFQYIYEVFLESNEYAFVYHLDQICHILLKYIQTLDFNKNNDTSARNHSQNKNCTKQLRQKMNFLIHLAIPINEITANQNGFKALTEVFIKLFNYEHFQINKISDYHKKQYDKSVNPISYATLSEAFNLGNFHQSAPKHPLLQILVCLKFFLVLLKFNRNIWTTFYEHKLVGAFSCLFLKIHSLLKFFLTPSIERQNVISEMKEHERVIQSYLQVAKDLTQIFIEKLKYESAFNELTQEEEIFNRVELYEKWFDTYLFLTNSINSNDFMINKPKIKQKIEIVLAHIIEIFDTVLLSYAITKHSSRQSKIRTLLHHIYKAHFESSVNRASILAILRDWVHFAGSNTLQLLKGFFASTITKNENKIDDIFLPANDKSVLANIIRKNMYRSDKYICNNLVCLLKQLLTKQSTNQLTLDTLDSILYQNEQLINSQNEDHIVTPLDFQKNILYINILANLKTSLSKKLDEHVMRYLKYIMNLKNIECSQKDYERIEIRKLKLKNSLLCYFSNSFMKDQNKELFTQFLRISNQNLNINYFSNSKFKKIQQMRICLTILKVISTALNNCYYQSILLYGQYIENPNKPDPLINLTHVFQSFLSIKSTQMADEQQQAILLSIGVSSLYLLSKLTSIDMKQFYSTQSRKNAINCLISPDKKINLNDLLMSANQFVPRQITNLLKNFNDFPIIQRPQIITEDFNNDIKKQCTGSIYSKSVFSMISESDPIGKTRFEFIQDPWLGGDTTQNLYKLHKKVNYMDYLKKQLQISQQLCQNMNQIKFIYNFKGLHKPTNLNKVFILKTKRNFTMKRNNSQFYMSDIIMKNNIPDFIKKPQQPMKQIKFPIQQIHNNPPINNIPINSPQQPNPRMGSTSPNLIRGTSNTNNINRSPSPYKPSTIPNQNPQINPTHPPNYPSSTHNNYPQNDNYHSYQPPVTSNLNPTYGTAGGYNNPAYDQRYQNNMHYDTQRGYYQNPQNPNYINQHQNPYGNRIDPRMASDPRAHNYPQGPYPGGSHYPPSYPNYHQGQNYNSGYHNNMNYPNYQNQNRENMLQQAYELLRFLKNHPNDPNGKSRLNELMKDQFIQTKIKEYVNSMKQK